MPNLALDIPIPVWHHNEVMPKSLRLPKVPKPTKACHNDTDRDILKMSDQAVMACMLSAKAYQNTPLLAFWKAVWAYKNDESDTLKLPVRTRSGRRPQGFHNKYYDENTVSNETIQARINNAIAWNDTLHVRLWSAILDKRIK